MKKACHPTKDAMWIRSGFHEGQFVSIEKLKKRQTASGEKNKPKFKRQTTSLQDKTTLKLSVRIYFFSFIIIKHLLRKNI
jgi:hypothetical protein